MATPNVGILTTAGKALIDKVNSGQAKISFSKVVFSSMDNYQLSDTQIKSLTAITPQEVVVSSPETTLDTNSGETRIRATGTNEKLADGVYVKTYGVFAKDDTGNEILYGVTVSPNPNYFPAYDGVTPQAVTYSYKTVIQETSNITMTNSNDVYVSQEDLTEAIDKIPQPDLSNYATKDQLATKADTSATEKNVADMNTELSGGLFFNTDLNTLNSPFAGGAYYYQVLVGGWDRIRQVAYLDLHASQIATRVSPDGGATWTAWVSLANTDDVTTAVSTATANMADTTKATNFTNGLQSGGVDVATAADLKSIRLTMWHEIELPDMFTGSPVLMKYNPVDQNTMIMGAKNATLDDGASWTGTLFTLPEGFHWVSTDSEMMPLYNMDSRNDNVSGRLYNTKLYRNGTSSDGSKFGIWFTALSRSIISIDIPYTVVSSIQPD